MVMNALVPSSSGISTPSAAVNVQAGTAGWLVPEASTYSRPLQMMLEGGKGGRRVA
jgi:hypothetical protein